MRKKILLADDSITIQKVIGIIFATEDYQLLVTDDGDEAFTKVQEEYPDLVIADVSMPGKDGFELCEAIKSDSRFVNTSVLLLPGTFDHFDEQKAQAVGADGWLTKPFESQALLDKVTQLLEADPIQLAGEGMVETSPEPEISDESVVDQPVDEEVLGLNGVAELAATDAVEEESPEDIWDAVSFEEEDLQEHAEPVAAVIDEPAPEAEAAELFTEADPDAAESYDSSSDSEAPTEEFVADQADDAVFEAEGTEPEVAEFGVEEAEDYSASTEEASTLAETQEQEDLQEEGFSAVEEVADLSEDDVLTDDSEEEILDLAEDDILEDEELEVSDQADMEDVADDYLATTEEEMATESIPAVPEPWQEQESYEEVAVEQAQPAEVAAAETAMADAEELIVDNSAELAAVAAVADFSSDDVTSAVTKTDIEQQLQQLSEDDLKEVVAKVAGPTIERLANEMLEKIVWEVVPDLAESMILEEIRKIKQGAR